MPRIENKKKNDTQETINKALSIFFQSEDFKMKISQAINQAIEKKINEMETRIEKLENENEDLNNRLNHMDQYKKNKNLRLYGLKNGKHNIEEEVTSFLNEKMKLEINVDEIQKCYHADKNKNCIVIKFKSRKIRNLVFYNKRKLKHTKNSIVEDLTSTNYKLLQECKKIFDNKNVWTSYGVIKIKKNDKIFSVKNVMDLQKLGKN